MADKVSIRGLVRDTKREEKEARKTITKDSFQNFAARMGVGTDNLTSYSTYGFNPITRIRMMLEWIHRGSWLGGVAVDAVADDMTKGGVKINSTLKPDQITQIEERATELCVWPSLRDNIAWTRLYGGSIAVLLVDGQKMSTPIRLETIGKDMFKGLCVLDRWMVEPSLGDLVTEFGPDLGMPKFYTVNANSPALIGERIHHTRAIRGKGIKLPFQQRMTENLWSISILERIYDRMIAYDSATQGMAQLVYKAYLRTVKMKDLRENIAAGGNQMDGVVQYMQMMARFQSIEGLTLLDLEDDFVEGGAQNFAGLREVLMSIGEQLAGAMDPPMPLVRMLGMSPAGFSTGDTDLRNWYDSVNKEQKTKLKIPVTIIYRCIAQSEGIEVPDGFAIDFTPLWQLTDVEKSQIASTVTTFVSQAREQGVIKPDLALKELKQSSDITGYWSNITDDEIKEAEEEGPPQPANVETAEAGQGVAPGAKQPPGGKAGGGGSKDSASTVAELLRLHDLHVVVENKAGTIRRGIGWESLMPDDYGYIRRHEGADGDAIDCFIGRDAGALNAYVIDQRDLRTGLFDEHKLMLGYPTAGAAIESYLLAYDDGDGNPERVMNVTVLTIDELKYWLAHSSQDEPCAGSYITLDARFREEDASTEDAAQKLPPRGKSTPESTPGSFKAGGGGSGKATPTPPSQRAPKVTITPAQSVKNIEYLQNHVKEIGYASQEEYDSEAAIDKARGYDWDKGQARYKVRAPKDRNEWPAHCLVIPPGAKNIVLCTNPDSAFIGSYQPLHGKGRQYKYTTKYTRQGKFIDTKRARELNTDEALVNAAVRKAISEKPVDPSAWAYKLIWDLALRSGDEHEQVGKLNRKTGEITGAGEMTYGATGLLGKHIVQRKDGVYIVTKGKKGSDIDLKVKDTKLADELIRRKGKGDKNDNKKIFADTSDAKIRTWTDTVKIGDHTLGKYKLHDVRKLRAKAQAVKMVGTKETKGTLDAPRTLQMWYDNMQSVFKECGKILVDTPGAAANTYIDPAAFDPWRVHEKRLKPGKVKWINSKGEEKLKTVDPADFMHKLRVTYGMEPEDE
jgi:phage-related protein (TIGR01555 family)